MVRLLRFGILATGAIIFYVLGLLLLAAGCLILIAGWEARSIPSRVSAVGTVTKVESPFSNSPAQLICPTVRFIVNHQTYHRRECQTLSRKEEVVSRPGRRGSDRKWVTQPNYRVGQTTTVWYVPANPETATIAEKYVHPFNRVLADASGWVGWSLPVLIVARCLQKVVEP